MTAEDITFTSQARETVTIMRPMPSVVPRGGASKAMQDPTTSIRFRPNELDAITEASAMLGMSRSAFTKWCAYYVALDIIQQHTEFVRSKTKKKK
jgi:hypothetical protein